MNDEQILDYLMTSDFDDNLSPDEYKNLLYKFRYFFRIVSSKSTNIEIEKKKFVFELDSLKVEKNIQIQNLTNKNQLYQDILKSLTNRKLSLKERFFGKLFPKYNEKP